MMNNHSAPKGKEKTDKPGAFARGGPSGQVGNQKGVVPSQPGKVTTNNGGDNKWGIGFNAGKGHMFPPQSADPSEPGVSADTSSKDKGGNDFKVSGGKTKMFGNTGSQPARPR